MPLSAPRFAPGGGYRKDANSNVAIEVDNLLHTPIIAFRHLPPNSAKFSYATEVALFISAQLSTDAVSALRKVRVLITLQTVVYDILPSGGRCRKAVFGVWVLM